MSRSVYLSYPLGRGTPSYGNKAVMEIEAISSMAGGDTSNSSRWLIPNHLGTHIDFPKHFVEGGKCADDYPASFWRFDSVAVIHTGETKPAMMIGPELIEKNGVPPKTELLIIVTGFYKFRGEPVYWRENPGFKPYLADCIRGACPEIRAIGFDSISLSSFADRPLGREAHRAFLGGPRPILPIEDMDLSTIERGTKIEDVIVAPLRVSGADAAPCTVVARIED